MDTTLVYALIAGVGVLGLGLIGKYLWQITTRSTTSETRRTSTAMGDEPSLSQQYPLSRASAYATGGDYSEPKLASAAALQRDQFLRGIERVFSPSAPTAHLNLSTPADHKHPCAELDHSTQLKSRSAAKIAAENLQLDLDTALACQKSLSEVYVALQQAIHLTQIGSPRQALDFLLRFAHQAVDCPPTPWIMLLNIYRETDKRLIYEKLLPRFEKRFGRAFPTWDQAPVGIHALGLHNEVMLRSRIQKAWGQPICLTLLYNALMDFEAPAQRFFNLVLQQELLTLAHDCPLPTSQQRSAPYGLPVLKIISSAAEDPTFLVSEQVPIPVVASERLAANNVENSRRLANV